MIPFFTYESTYIAPRAPGGKEGARRGRRAKKRMANKPVEALIKCPFYLRQTENTLICEGVLKGTVMLTQFQCASLKRAHYKQSCFHEDGGECFLAKSLYEKYGE